MSDPHRDLWWAHTGAGGGNFGVVTRYWFRAPNVSGDDPAELLPHAPESITTFTAEWSWADLSQPSFLRLVRNHGVWCERNSDADAPNASLWTLLQLHRQQFGKIIVRFAMPPGGVSAKVKDALLKTRFTDRQIAVAYDYLTRTDHDVTTPTSRIRR